MIDVAQFFPVMTFFWNNFFFTVEFRGPYVILESWVSFERDLTYKLTPNVNNLSIAHLPSICMSSKKVQEMLSSPAIKCFSPGILNLFTAYEHKFPEFCLKLQMKLIIISTLKIYLDGNIFFPCPT